MRLSITFLGLRDHFRQSYDGKSLKKEHACVTKYAWTRMLEAAGTEDLKNLLDTGNNKWGSSQSISVSNSHTKFSRHIAGQILKPLGRPGRVL
jgi:hypothetical protein